MQRTWNQLTGLFLIDRSGIVRWAFVEAAVASGIPPANDGPAGMGRYPPETEIVAATQTILHV